MKKALIALSLVIVCAVFGGCVAGCNELMNCDGDQPTQQNK